MGDVKLVLSIILRPLVHVESHCSNVVLGDIHLVGSLFVLGRELLPHVRDVVVQSLAVCALVLGKRATGKVCLIHLHRVHLLSVRPDHVHGRAAAAVIRSGASV